MQPYIQLSASSSTMLNAKESSVCLIGSLKCSDMCLT